MATFISTSPHLLLLPAPRWP